MTTVREKPRDEELAKISVAYHEAGHGVVANRFGHYGAKTTIVPDEAEGILGSCITEAEWIDGSKHQEQILVLFAGHASEKAYNPDICSDPEQQQDTLQARFLLQVLPEGTEHKLRVEADRLVRENWPHIEACATALIEKGTLEEEELDIIISAIDEGENWRGLLERLRFNKSFPSTS